ncbi:AraC family transcriptional regulator [Pedobacter sp. ok626]
MPKTDQAGLNTDYFSRIFKRITGLTPGAYRKQNKTMNFIDG